jgi:hypothetical protein
MELTPENIRKVVMDCLFKETEVVNGKPIVEPVAVKSIMRHMGFHPSRIKEHEKDIQSMLEQLPTTFFAWDDEGGGDSFLNMCMTKDNRQWGEHDNMDELICLGMAIGKVQFPLPREYWSRLPGGVPYVIVYHAE